MEKREGQILAVLLSLCIVGSLVAVAESQTTATCYYDQASQRYSLRQGIIDPNGVAWGTYYEELNTTGWSRLYISSNGSFTNEQQSYCAGYVEGFITADRIQQWLTTYKINFFNNKPMNDKLASYMKNQLSFSRSHANMFKASQPLWRNIFYILRQFDGLLEGVNNGLYYLSSIDKQRVFSQISEMDLYALNSAGDLLTLVDVFPSEDKELLKKQREFKMKFQGQEEDEEYLHLECSALIKYTGPELFVAHNTWTAFYSMYRIFKTYDIQLAANDDSVLSNKVMFSSRPGFLQSKDDFYMMDSGLVSQETTNSIYNTTLYELYVVPQTLLTWQRVIAANRMALNGSSWVEIFSQYNSGTYNNQWMVVDYKLFVPNQPIQEDTLWILEQMPGMCVWGDVSYKLAAQSFWSSFNVPYFAQTYNRSGYKGTATSDGQGPEYIAAPRYQIFAQQEGKVADLATMKYVMQYNDYTEDPLSKGDPANAIASRYDLRATRPNAFGAIDAKIASYSNINNMECDAISGPTHQGLTPFSWDPQWTSVYHQGMPELWNFDWRHISSHANSK